MTGFPFLTAYDPPGSSEGALDPLGLYLIAEHLASELVPAVRERMQRVRFLTAIAVGCLVVEGLEDDPRSRDASPYLVWEWLLVEAFIRTRRNSDEIWGTPGTLVTARAIDNQQYLDGRSYLKTARIFGFHGVYKRLAHHLGITNVNLGPGPAAEGVVDAWAKSVGYPDIKSARPLLDKWSRAVRSSLLAKPTPHTYTNFKGDDWENLASAFLPGQFIGAERNVLRELILSTTGKQLGALPTMWKLQNKFTNDDYREEDLHAAIASAAPEYGPLLKAIKAYESFVRSLQDAFDLLRAEASKEDCIGYPVTAIAADSDFKNTVSNLEAKFYSTYQELGNVSGPNLSLQNLFSERFTRFAQKMSPDLCASELCDHHEFIQKAKSQSGKRAWFDRIAQDRIYIRHAYRIDRKELQPDRYVHDYRGWPVRRFWEDLA